MQKQTTLLLVLSNCAQPSFVRHGTLPPKLPQAPLPHSRLLEPRPVEGAEALFLPVAASPSRGRGCAAPHPPPVIQNLHAVVIAVEVLIVFGALELRKGWHSEADSWCEGDAYRRCVVVSMIWRALRW